MEHELHVNAHRIARHPAMKAHTTPKNPLVNSLRKRLVRRALKAAMARQAAATAAAVTALKKECAALLTVCFKRATVECYTSF